MRFTIDIKYTLGTQEHTDIIEVGRVLEEGRPTTTISRPSHLEILVLPLIKIFFEIRRRKTKNKILNFPKQFLNL